MSAIKVLDVKISTENENEILSIISGYLEKSKPRIIVTPNTEIIVSAQSNDQLKEILNKKSAINLPDGVGLLWAANFQQLNLPDTPFWAYLKLVTFWGWSILTIPFLSRSKKIFSRISGSDFVLSLADLAKNKKYRLFLLGGGITVAERAALKLQTDIPDLRVVGVSSKNPEDADEVVEMIKKSRADILLVAYGSPKQEIWLSRYLGKTGCKIGIGVGGTFDFLAEIRPRAPKWVRSFGLEWLHRLINEPKRIFRQMAIPKFMWLNLVEKAKSIK